VPGGTLRRRAPSCAQAGRVDEAFIVATTQGPQPRAGNVGAPVDPRETTRVVEFNDPGALERELSHGDVAAVLMEPALTNIGIVLPEAGYLDTVRTMTRRHGTLLINDETHTFSAGPGGCPEPPRTGGQSEAAADTGLDEYLHLYMINRGILMTPFHNMALMCPATTDADADAHTAVFAAAADELLG
jgi:glutamate-1-semialdehyde aminotransferase